MATGVPLVTTRVGQAADLVETRGTAISWTSRTRTASPAGGDTVAERSAADRCARSAAAGTRDGGDCSYEALAPRWRELLDGFVELGRA